MLAVKLNCYQVILALDSTRRLIQAHLSTFYFGGLERPEL